MISCGYQWFAMLAIVRNTAETDICCRADFSLLTFISYQASDIDGHLSFIRPLFLKHPACAIPVVLSGSLTLT
ncbi:hypothetical protein [Undibacterium luofuense]|uniref:Uncharacterized protein n=1 Tax=Undibacterium luofuense TaxID=2828733 RepID=A0A941DNK3_9BURK|nr:hypothetical protein [Undibacterium luofuense]MBR7784183.1 hypothetical protein [Undibacterium luofuense]